MTGGKHVYLFAGCALLCAMQAAAALAGPYDPPAGYYDSATGTGATLKSHLTTVMSSDHIQRSYGDFRYSAVITDADPDAPGNILLVYNRASVPGVWSTSPLVWNREHLWPQALQPGSASNGTSGNLGDPHALRPANPTINSNRGNMPFGFEETTGANRNLGTYYFPGDFDKGDIARQLFYTDTRYSTSGLSLTDSFPDGNQMGDLSSLIAWHYLDPPDEFELRRNHAIYSSAMNPTYYTNNRNAYIDRPEFVWSVYVDQQNDSQIVIDGAPVGNDGATSSVVDLGRVLVGAATPAAQSVSINKNGNDGTYFEISTTGEATSSLGGRTNAFRTEGTDSTSIDVGLDTSTATAGLRSGWVTIDNLDVTTAGGTGHGANDANDVVMVNLDVLDHANASFASNIDLNGLTHDFGTISLDDSVPTFDFEVFNLIDEVGFTADLELDRFSSIGDTDVLTTDLTPIAGTPALAAGTSGMFTATLDTTTVGDFSATYTLNFSDEDLPGASPLGDLTLTLSGSVVAAAIAGDFDEDGDTDGGDFLAWQQGFDHDFNADDLADWQANFGYISEAASGVSSTVPEPTALLLLVIGLAGSSLAQRRRWLRVRCGTPQRLFFTAACTTAALFVERE